MTDSKGGVGVEAGVPSPLVKRRRRLRTRVIVAFVLLGFGLTALFAVATLYHKVFERMAEGVGLQPLHHRVGHFLRRPHLVA